MSIARSKLVIALLVAAGAVASAAHASTEDVTLYDQPQQLDDFTLDLRAGGLAPLPTRRLGDVLVTGSIDRGLRYDDRDAWWLRREEIRRMHDDHD